MHRTGRTPLLLGAALALAATLAATGCTTDGPERSDRTEQSDGTDQPAAEVHTDTQLLARCTTLPAEADSVHWIYRGFGDPNSRLPGPIDYGLDGIAHLTDDGAARLRASATWEPTGDERQPPAELAALLDHPVSGWLRTPALDPAGSKPVHFLLAPDSNTLFFWAVNPHCTH
ncbi:hypothetical protein [Kitasatospora sp. NPDC057198]|uniref:hypothetical protein n=1 Tax=Kitasatospora sp. NPDC057198 TaxID=3346046 RepID=UPI003641A4D2